MGGRDVETARACRVPGEAKTTTRRGCIRPWRNRLRRSWPSAIACGLGLSPHFPRQRLALNPSLVAVGAGIGRLPFSRYPGATPGTALASSALPTLLPDFRKPNAIHDGPILGRPHASVSMPKQKRLPIFWRPACLLLHGERVIAAGTSVSCDFLGGLAHQGKDSPRRFGHLCVHRELRGAVGPCSGPASFPNMCCGGCLVAAWVIAALS